jgi:hypothetical protein
LNGSPGQDTHLLKSWFQVWQIEVMNETTGENKLLTESIIQRSNDRRELFNLAMVHYNAGQIKEAAQAFAGRASIDDGCEEAWYARVMEARCLKKLGDDEGFVNRAITAFNMKPDRAEPLYDLARYYRERSMFDVSVLFCEAGLKLAIPSHGSVFLENYVYTAGLLEEYSIVANYARDPTRKGRGRTACNWLALDREIPDHTGELARSNLFFYAEPFRSIMPSFAPRQIGFVPPDAYRPTNPSVTLHGEQILVIVRGVNYDMLEGGAYRTQNGEPFRTRNFLLRLSDELKIESSVEILVPENMPEPAYRDETAFGDLRLFAWRGDLWCSACYRELTPEGWCEQVLARVGEDTVGNCQLTDWRVLRPDTPKRHEKNWMPQVVGGALRFIYLCDPTRVIDDQAQTVFQACPAIAASHFRGGSQAIPFDGGALALVHEVIFRGGRRFYLHRFVWFDAAGALKRVSRQFFFHKKGIEFAAGLAWHPNGKQLLISYGVDDGEAWIATIDAFDVQSIMEKVDGLKCGALFTNEQTVFDTPSRDDGLSQGIQKCNEAHHHHDSISALSVAGSQPDAGVTFNQPIESHGPHGEGEHSTMDVTLREELPHPPQNGQFAKRRVIVIRHRGNLANKMLQYMGALTLASTIKDCEVVNVSIPEWGIEIPDDTQNQLFFENIDLWSWDAFRPHLHELSAAANQNQSIRIMMADHLQRMEFFRERAFYNHIFPNVGPLEHKFTEDDLVINIRTAEILSGVPHYPILPIAFYEDIISKTGKTPIFIGQLNSSEYVRRLKQCFPQATFIESRGARADFDLLRSAKNIVVAVSTFSWLAAWLSDAQNIILPLSGFFNPSHHREIDLLPTDDIRYRFFLFPLNYGLPEQESLHHHQRMKGQWKEISRNQVSLLKSGAPFLRPPRENYDGGLPARSARGVQITFDPVWYAHEYIDAAMEISEGWFEDPLHHYLEVGRLRGYLPTRPTPHGRPLDLTLPNLALNKPATQSSISQWSRGRSLGEDAGNAVNGKPWEDIGFHTDEELNPWWMVDLGVASNVHYIRIFNRDRVPEHIQRRAAPLVIEVSDDGDCWRFLLRTQNGQIFGGYSGGHPLVWSGQASVEARFVRLSIPRRDYLHLAEVEIYGKINSKPVRYTPLGTDGTD